MAVKETNQRIRIKRSTVAGEVPTTPGTGATSLTDHTLGGWLDTDLYVGELFINTTDDKMWFRSDNGINLVGYSAMTCDFLDLGDTPSSYASYGGYFVRVHSGETALEFYEFTGLTWTIEGATDFIGLSPHSGYTGQVLTYQTSGFTLESYNTDYINLTDVFNTGYTQAGDIIHIHSGNTGLEFIDGATKFVDLSSDQTIGGIKTFTSAATFQDGIYVDDFIVFSGSSNTVVITNIVNDSGFTGYNATSLATSGAIKDYIDTQILGTGGTSNFVTLGTTQTITATKTFTPWQIFTSGLSAGLVQATDMYLNNDITTELTSMYYLGDNGTDASYRWRINAGKSLAWQGRDSAVWNSLMGINYEYYSGFMGGSGHTGINISQKIGSLMLGGFNQTILSAETIYMPRIELTRSNETDAIIMRDAGDDSRNSLYFSGGTLRGAAGWTGTVSTAGGDLDIVDGIIRGVN